jgi:hypothetical protein
MLLKVDIKWGVIMYGNSLVLHAWHPMDVVNTVIWYLKTLMPKLIWALCSPVLMSQSRVTVSKWKLFPV